MTGQEKTVRGRRGNFDPAVFAVAAGSLFALLLLRNPVTFGRVVYERGDFAANSVITADAKHLELLVGNYSRLGFHHPGPAFFYVQAFGEWLWYDLLGAVPTPWNGQWIGLLALNSVLLGLCLAILHSWTASRRVTALCGAAGLLYFAVQPAILASAWMPDLYVAPFLLLLTAAASVAAGRVAHLPALALAAGLLVHGHVSFLLFAPVIAGAAVLASLWTGRPAWRAGRLAVLGAAGVLALFALPIVLNLLLHWPGEFARYFGYGGAHVAPPAGDVLHYVLRYYASWTPLGALAAAAFFGGAALLVRRLPAGPPRRFLAAGVCAAVLATILFVGYVARAVDDLRFTYVGQFSRAVPLLLLLVVVAASASAPGARVPGWLGSLSAAGLRHLTRFSRRAAPVAAGPPASPAEVAGGGSSAGTTDPPPSSEAAELASSSGVAGLSGVAASAGALSGVAELSSSSGVAELSGGLASSGVVGLSGGPVAVGASSGVAGLSVGSVSVSGVAGAAGRVGSGPTADGGRLPVWLASDGRRLPVWFAAAVVIGALGVGSRAPALHTMPEHVPDMPAVMAALHAYTGGRTAVLDVQQDTWPALTALVVHGDRMGPRVCARDPWWEFMLTDEYICTPDDIAVGRPVRLVKTAPEGATVIAPVDESVLTAG
ncbi:hypothetical protein [Phytohabitans kaempferiae]|uniref:Glycosyltransferase RgtA/B/C/D-like domain-containing protein n=1 Tax=Phytohabitans kaempferiae TaxID=1620943 RepID=A0ABV6MEC8_9ACTN